MSSPSFSLEKIEEMMLTLKQCGTPNVDNPKKLKEEAIEFLFRISSKEKKESPMLGDSIFENYMVLRDFCSGLTEDDAFSEVYDKEIAALNSIKRQFPKLLLPIYPVYQGLFYSEQV